VTATIDGDSVRLGVDNGSAGTWVSDSLTTKWKTRHADWPRAIGAAGSANFFGFPFETGGVLMSLPEVRLGSLRSRNVTVLGLDQGMFDWYSQKSAGPVQGFIGANVLREYRLEIDFPSQMTWWEAGPVSQPGDLDIVGLTLRPERDGGLSIAGVVQVGDKAAVDGVQRGDRLVRVDALDVAGATMGRVVQALRGKPGSTRRLVLEREGRRYTVQARVLRLP
jgi:hypothetical protein